MVNVDKVSDEVYAVTDGSIHGNVAALVLSSKIAVIDTSFDINLILEFRKKIEKIAQKKVKLVFLTHYHSDHCRGLPAFKDCRIYSNEILLKKIMKRKPPRGYENVLPGELFEDYLELKEDNIKIILKKTQGHTIDSTYIYCPEYKVVFAGDSLFINRYPFGGDASVDPQKWEETILEFIDLDVKHYIPGHGPVVDKEGVREFYNFLYELNSSFKENIRAGKSEEEIKKSAYKIGNFESMRAQDITIMRFYRYWSKKQKK